MKVKVKFENIEALQQLINAVHNYRMFLAQKLDRQLNYINDLLRISLLDSLHKELLRFMYRASPTYPTTKSFETHKAIVMQESLQQHATNINDTYYLVVNSEMIASINQQL